ncbi:glycoside hydrolase, partial [Chytriomyces sp. MP71]
GLGWSYTACVGNTAPIPSINFPGLCLQDSPTGIRFALNVSAFPASINVAATFDETLMYNNGRYMGEELRDKGVNLHLAPVANMMRTPQGGRGWEAQGADPFLTGTSVTNIIAGVQSNGVQSTLK